MHLIKKLGGSNTVSIVMRKKAQDRLKGTCFRGFDVHQAGNFMVWRTPDEVFADEIILQQFLETLHEDFVEGFFGTSSVEISHDNIIGWDSTVPCDIANGIALECIKFGRGIGMKIPARYEGVFAPVTRSVTIVYELKVEERGRLVTVIHSMYPGVDVGELTGDVTSREGRIFFDFAHPGVSERLKSLSPDPYQYRSLLLNDT